MQVAAVIPNWNGAQLLRRLFPTLAAQTRPFDSVIVVDNGSSDDSVAVSERFGATRRQVRHESGVCRRGQRGLRRNRRRRCRCPQQRRRVEPDVAGECYWPDSRDETVAFVSGKTVMASDPSVARRRVRCDISRRLRAALWVGHGRWSVLERRPTDPIRAFDRSPRPHKLLSLGRRTR